MIQQKITIIDKAGLHARPASMICKIASQYPENITLTFKEHTINLKSILGVLSLGIPRNSEIVISVSGNHEEEVLFLLLKHFKEHQLID